MGMYVRVLGLSGVRHVCAAVCVVATMSAAPADGAEKRRLSLPGIKGIDERIIIDSAVYPWRAVGRVNRRIGGHCTGVLVASDKVLTAAHCLWNKRTQRWLNADALHFLAGYTRGEYRAHSRIVALDLSPGSTPGPNGKVPLTQDFALLTLAERLGDNLGTLSLAETIPTIAYRSRVVVQAGYSQDKAHILTLHHGCRLIKKVGAGLLAHDCDATKGDSGSPLFLIDAGRIAIIGLHVATAGRPGFEVGVAVSSAAIRSTLLDALRR